MGIALQCMHNKLLLICNAGLYDKNGYYRLKCNRLHPLHGNPLHYPLSVLELYRIY